MIILDERGKNRTNDDKLHIPMLGVGFLKQKGVSALKKVRKGQRTH